MFIDHAPVCFTELLKLTNISERRIEDFVVPLRSCETKMTIHYSCIARGTTVLCSKGAGADAASLQASAPVTSACPPISSTMYAYFDCPRAEVSQYNISVCVVSPYYINTNLSLNALTGDGSSYGKVDTTTKAGLKPDYVAGEIVKCVTRKVDELMLAPLHVQLAICLRALAPWLFFKLMASRAKTESEQYSKNN